MNPFAFDVLPSDWNHRVLGIDDFYSFCKQEGVEVYELDMSIDGLYTIFADVPVILLKLTLSEPDLTFVAFHELAHYWLHEPGQQFKWAFESKMDFEANLVASCALIPCSLLESHASADIQRQFGYSTEVIQFREQVYRDWKI